MLHKEEEKYKLIFKGHLDFGTERSYKNVLKMCEWKVENLYKRDLQFSLEEDLFIEGEETSSYRVAFEKIKVLKTDNEKHFHANAGLLAYMSDYAISGNMEAWMIRQADRKMMSYRPIRPQGDRAAVANYIKACDLIDGESEDDNYEAAKTALDKAIKKYENHSLAYERRGIINIKLEKYHDAKRDFQKSIEIYDLSPEPFYGSGVVHKIEENYESAVTAFDGAVKRSIPLQDIHWKARRRKAESLMALERFEDAAKELKFFVKRKHEETSPNFKYLRKAFYDYGVCQVELGLHKEAAKAFDEAINHDEGRYAPAMENILFYRGIARKAAKMPNFEVDLKKAADAGHVTAAKVLKK